ncbi:MAG: hypothetical protein ACOCVV_04585 [Marinobacter sp.]
MATSNSKTAAPPGRQQDRRFAVSANRGAAHHRVRYVETGGATVDTGDCTLCQASPELDWTTASADETERRERSRE